MHRSVLILMMLVCTVVSRCVNCYSYHTHSPLGVLPSPGGGLSGGAIAGIVIGVLVFVLCCVAVIVLAIWKGKYIKKCVKPVKRTFTLQHSRRRRRPSPSLPVVQSELTEDENHTEDENQRELTEKEVLSQ